MGGHRIKLNAGKTQIDLVIPDDFPWEKDHVLRRGGPEGDLTLYGLYEQAQAALDKAYSMAVAGMTDLMRGAFPQFYRNWVMFADQAGFFPIDKLMTTWQTAKNLAAELATLAESGGSEASLFQSMQRRIFFDVDTAIVNYARDLALVASRFSGKGHVVTLAGKRFEGDFVDGELVNGTITYPGEEYLAKLTALQISVGTSVPRKYVGRVSRWLPNGAGRMENSDGRVREGEFRDGKLISGRAVMADGTVLEGQFQNGVLEGQGRLSLPNGVVYRGSFKHGRPHGEVVVTDPNGPGIKAIFEDGQVVRRL
ncbi:MAG: hypothetical protein LBD90_03615 [Bifidobacteriaceae bacterium]|jgi:hypothetical protein|nr:hypothetical protein [Bifidobacteriaceae bacterium]